MFRWKMRALLFAAVAVALVAGLVVSSAYYLSLLNEKERSYQALLSEAERSNQRLQAQLAEANNRINQLQSEIQRLQMENQNIGERSRQLTERVASLEERLETLTSQLEDVRRTAGQLSTKLDRVSKILSLLENDRVLLSWIRTDPPGERESARQFWNETRALALKSEPNLAPTVDKILVNLDLYFDWVEKAPQLTSTSREDILRWCPLFVDWLLNAPPGVDQYENAIQQFREEVFLTIIAHIDSLMNALEG